MLPSLLGKALHALTENPLNLFLVFLLAYVLVQFLYVPPTTSPEVTPPVAVARRTLDTSSPYCSIPQDHPNSTEFLRYTPKTLALFDGTGPGGDGKILLAINGKVFDVTSGRTFYGPDGPYGNFAGRDASRGMAKQSFDLAMLTPLDQRIDTLADLNDAERKNMNEWESHFTGKYGVVGELVNEGE
ncbi:Dihydrodipicolinate synthase [Malassezia sp. CBS 17886]|nr:Dihydrodipicolinate synthase [Malassezia sp. CBS 17886]